MIIQEVNWLRGQSGRVCPELRKQVLNWYRPSQFTPCFLNKSQTWLQKKLRKYPVIVQLSAEEASVMSVQSLADITGCRVKREMPLIHSFATDVNEDILKKLLQYKGVRKIWYDREVKAVLDVASPTVGADHQWEEGFTGKGIVIAVLDTGIYDHPNLAGRIVGFKDFVNNRDKTYDDNGHGTHVAGCAAAGGDKYRSPAPEAMVVGVKVLNKTGSGTLSTVIQGIQWCVFNKNVLKIRILNLSLGSEGNQSYLDDPVCQAVEKSWEAGLVVCAAAGNSGPQPRTVNSPGISPVILTVGALNDMGTRETTDDRMAEFSSRGPTYDGLTKPDVVAPGVNIVSLRSPGSFIDKQNKSSRVGENHISLSGTSMATPVCAGVAAQVLQKNPQLNPDQVKQLLVDTAVPLASFGANDQGSGMVHAGRAINAV